MADEKKISGLTEASDALASDEFVMVNKAVTSGADASASGQTSKITLDNLRNAILGGSSGSSGGLSLSGLNVSSEEDTIQLWTTRADQYSYTNFYNTLNGNNHAPIGLGYHSSGDFGIMRLNGTYPKIRLWHDDSKLELLSTLYVTDSGKVGIGTFSPSCDLEVEGNSAETEVKIGLSSADGTQNAAIAHVDEEGAERLSFRVGGFGSGVDKMTILNNGAVGIGTSSPHRGGVASGRALEIKDSAAAVLRLNRVNGQNEAVTDFSVYTGLQALDFYDNKNDVSRLVINNSGNVGIGTVSPLTSLHIHRKGLVSGDQLKKALILDSDPGDYGNYAGISFRVGGAEKGSITQEQTGRLYIQSKHDTNHTNGHLILQRNGGNVGVGYHDNSPRGKFHVFSDEGESAEIYFENQNSGQNQNSKSPRLNFVGKSQNAGYGIQANGKDAHGRKDLVFYGHDADDYVTYQENVRFTHDGNVGIGTNRNNLAESIPSTNPINQLEVRGFLTGGTLGLTRGYATAANNNTLGIINFFGQQSDSTLEPGARIVVNVDGDPSAAANDMPAEMLFDICPGGTSGLQTGMKLTRHGQMHVGWRGTPWPSRMIIAPSPGHDTPNGANGAHALTIRCGSAPGTHTYLVFAGDGMGPMCGLRATAGEKNSSGEVTMAGHLALVTVNDGVAGTRMGINPAGLVTFYEGTAGTSAFDERNLENIRSTSVDGLDKINNINVRDFESNGETQTGIVAQELGEVVASAVYEAEDNNEVEMVEGADVDSDAEVATLLATKPQDLIPILVKAVQELSAKVDELSK